MKKRLVSCLYPFIGNPLYTLQGNTLGDTNDLNRNWVTDGVLVLSRSDAVNKFINRKTWEDDHARGSYLGQRIIEFTSKVEAEGSMESFELQGYVRSDKRWRKVKNMAKFSKNPIDAKSDNEERPLSLVVFYDPIWNTTGEWSETAYTFYGQRRFLAIKKCWPHSKFGFIWVLDTRVGEKVRVLIAYNEDSFLNNQINALLYPTVHKLNPID